MRGREATPREAALAVELLESSPDGLLIVDADGRIALANGAASSIFGFAGDGLIGVAFDDLVPVEQRQPHTVHRQTIEPQPERGPMGISRRLLGRHRSGNTFPVEVGLSPITIDGAVQTVATIRDVTEREQASASLLLHEDRQRHAADLHDLVIQRIFAIGMSLQSVTNFVESPAARNRIVAATEELDETISVIREAMSSTGTSADLQSLTSQIDTLVHERSRHLGFTPDLAVVGAVDDLPDFVADQLVATLTEAVSNIAQHADATSATIRITRTDGVVKLVVSDNGRGIDSAPKALGGLSDIMWRAAELGGSCSVTPVDPSGTDLVWEVPA